MSHVPFGERPEWADVTPIPQDDGPTAVSAIAYPAYAKDTMDYFRAVMAGKELSQRALDLTGEVIECNAANYTAWYYRRLCLEALGVDLRKELEFVQAVADENPKNYQIWYHRRVIVEKLGDPSGELEVTAAVLADESKNYHAWAHRQWVVEAFKLWDGELAYVEDLLQADVRNNSAWNHRWFVISHSEGYTPEVRAREVDYAFGHLQLVVSNPSPWAYLLGILRGQDLAAFPNVATFLEALAAKGHGDNVELLSFRVRLLMSASPAGDAAEVAALCDKLALVDPMRSKYWAHMKATAATK